MSKTYFSNTYFFFGKKIIIYLSYVMSHLGLGQLGKKISTKNIHITNLLKYTPCFLRGGILIILIKRQNYKKNKTKTNQNVNAHAK